MTASRLPNFFIAGVPKAGTTSLCDIIAKHNDVFLSDEKEPYHFLFPSDGSSTGLFIDNECTTSLEETRYIQDRSVYEDLYRDGQNLKYRLDGSTQYFVSEVALEEIYQASPEAKFVIQLRDPVERAWSSYQFSKSRGSEKYTFSEAIELELQGARDAVFTDGYLGTSTYGKHLPKFYNRFGQDQVLVTYYEDFVKAPEDVVRQITEFLGLPEFDALPQIERKNATLITSNRLLRAIRFLGTSLRQKNAWIKSLPGASLIHSYILSKSEKAEKISLDERQFFESQLEKEAEKWPLSKLLPDSPYRILG